MAKKAKITITEIAGAKSPDMESAQVSALTATAADLASKIRELLARGILVNQNGRIIPNPQGDKNHA